MEQINTREFIQRGWNSTEEGRNEDYGRNCHVHQLYSKEN